MLFQAKPLVKYFKRHGLEAFEIERVDTKGGSLRGKVQKIGASRPIDPAVSERMKMEEDEGFDSLEFYKEFAEQRERAKKDLINLLEDLKSEGKSIAGYGASVGVTTLLYYYGADKYIDVLFDDNPVKQGLYSPGHHIPVLPSDEIYSRRPDYIIFFSWRYKEPIMKRHAKYKENGGKFIIPLPEVEVI